MAFKSTDYEKATYKARGKLIEIQNLFISKVAEKLKGKRFVARFKYDGKIYTKYLGYTELDKLTPKKAQDKANEFKNEKVQELQNITGGFDKKTILNSVANVYFSKKCDTNSEWTEHRKNVYKLYIKNDLGLKKVVDIRPHHIDNLQSKMREKGYSKQTANGCSLRTIKKVLIQTLKPILEYAKDNKVIDDIPKIEIIKTSKQKNTKKKTVSNAGKKLATLFTTINEFYKDNPFYRALFLFALYGRRWNEIRTLQWTDIDFLNNTYTVRAENNKIGEDQSYDLPLPISEALKQIEDDNRGLVFKSPVTGKELYPPKKQLAHIKEKSNIPELTMHYFRHILVSAMGEMGTANTILSASLGHTNLQTVNDYYLTVNHTRATKETNVLIDNIVRTK